MPPSSLSSDLTQPEQLSLLKSIAIRYLSFRPRFKSEVIKRLQSKASELQLSNSDALINQIISWLEEAKFLDDEKLLESFIRHRQQERSKGTVWIKAKLHQIGLPSSTIDTAIKKYSSNDAQQTAIHKIIHKLSQGHKPDLKTKAKIYRHLIGRGFSYSQIKKVFDATFQK